VKYGTFNDVCVSITGVYVVAENRINSYDVIINQFAFNSFIAITITDYQPHYSGVFDMFNQATTGQAATPLESLILMMSRTFSLSVGNP